MILLLLVFILLLSLAAITISVSVKSKKSDTFWYTKSEAANFPINTIGYNPKRIKLNHTIYQTAYLASSETRCKEC